MISYEASPWILLKGLNINKETRILLKITKASIKINTNIIILMKM